MDNMQQEQVEAAIREYLVGVLHMSLATCAGNKPWVCEVHFVYDEDLNLYFRSKASRRHSQEIAANPQVAGNIVEQHGPTDKPRGVYFEGTAEQLSGIAEDSPVVGIFRERLAIPNDIVADAAEADGHKFYKITVSDFYLFDARESKPATKYHLNWKGKA